VLRKSGLHLLSILPKSSFGRDKFAEKYAMIEGQKGCTYVHKKDGKVYAPQTKILEG
jgi:hypothetical protein